VSKLENPYKDSDSDDDDDTDDDDDDEYATPRARPRGPSNSAARERYVIGDDE
jgi:hypothetical protein